MYTINSNNAYNLSYNGPNLIRVTAPTGINVSAENIVVYGDNPEGLLKVSYVSVDSETDAKNDNE